MSDILTAHQSQYYAWQLTRKSASDSVESFAATLVDAQVDLNPHQVDAAVFACQNPLSRGVILADEVGLGKTIEAGLVISQRWAERKRKILIITPANLRKQWHQELIDKFGLQGMILESKSYNVLCKQGMAQPFMQNIPIICSYQFAKTKADDLKRIDWDLVVMDEAHRLRNVYKTNNVIGKTLKEALTHVHSKILLTATPLQNSLLELYGLVSMIDDRVFGDIDSFRSQFSGAGSKNSFESLRARLSAVCQRTLRRQVQPYVAYTARRAIVQEFTPSQQEQRLSELVAEYLRRPNLKALPEGQRQLISLVLWKLLASSSRAIAGALGTMAERLQKLQNQNQAEDLASTLDEDYESLDETVEEWEEETKPEKFDKEEQAAIAAEIQELRHFKELADTIQDDAKGQALFEALNIAFEKLDELGAEQKAIIFTESKRTQEYLLSLLSQTHYAGEDGNNIVLFNGTNSDAKAQKIYKAWLKRHEGSDKMTGSKTADTRAALVEHFKERGTIMIATEAGSEGINLQFCSLVINYDLPWNPQRIEQRIGRCHRYGQKHDVVVVNFVDRSNEADRRVYELLEQKFQLFNGVFGASDEVLGAIGSGVDIERRIAEIYRNCRHPDEIQQGFEALQQELSNEINERMLQARQNLLENFDEEVQSKLNLRAKDSQDARSRFEKLLMAITATELKDYAQFEGNGFILQKLPEGISNQSLTAAELQSQPIQPIQLGRYELPRQQEDAHLYRISHPLAQWALDQAKSRNCPKAKLTFDYSSYDSKISTLEPYIGKSGYILAKLVNVTALNNEEQHLVLSAITQDGEILEADDPEKLLKLPATSEALKIPIAESMQRLLKDDNQHRQDHLLTIINQRNLGYFDQEVQKLEEWADDLKLGLEQQIKDIDQEIKEARRTAATAATLDEKLSWQKKQRELESKRTKMRKALFDRQDDIELQRNALIEQLERQLEQKVEEQELFTVEWEII